jgi:hypothetical protein
MNFTWTPMDDSVKVVNSLLGGRTNGVHGGSSVLSSDGKTSIDFLELLVNGPPLPGPLAYVSDGFVDQCNRRTSGLLMALNNLQIPIFCRLVAAIMLAPLVFLMLLDLVAYRGCEVAPIRFNTFA